MHANARLVLGETGSASVRTADDVSQTEIVADEVIVGFGLTVSLPPLC